MKSKPNNYYDLAIVDPPYGINAPNMSMGSNPNRKDRDQRGELQYGGISTAQKLKKGRLNSGAGKLKNRALNTMNCEWDFEKPSPEYFQELFRVSKNQIIWGGNYFDLPPTRGFIIWNKDQPWDNFSQAEFAWTSFDRPAKLFTYSNRGGLMLRKKFIPPKNLSTCMIIALSILLSLDLRYWIRTEVQAQYLQLVMTLGVIWIGVKLILSIFQKQKKNSLHIWLIVILNHYFFIKTKFNSIQYETLLINCLFNLKHIKLN